MADYRITMENIRGDEIRDKPYGDGTIDSPYKISSPENLVYLAEHDYFCNGKYMIQTNNIDMDGYEFIPIGYKGTIDGHEFPINYNGNGYSISNINNSPLFGKLFNSTIKNILINNFSITDSNANSIVFLSIKNSLIENISIINSEIHSSYRELGILTGTYHINNFINNITIDNCIVECLYNGNYSSTIGGAIGNIYQEQQPDSIKNIIVKNSTIKGASTIGGVIGGIEDGHIVINGIASINNTIISDSYYNPTNPFNIYQSINIGGIIGNGSVKNGYSANNTITVDRNLTDRLNAGGISGLINNNIESCLLNCWSNSSIVNNVTVDDINIGGICGYFSNIFSDINNSYWDEDVSGINTCCGFNSTGISANAITTAELAQQSTFTDWDFTDIWEMGANYPVLQFESFIIEKETEVFEYNFEYPILKGSTQYDPFSYISYDYMISTSRRAKFDALILDYFDEESFDFVNMLTRVGYKKYDNDIKLYNHYYYSTEDDEDEFVRIELDDNTIKHEIGTNIIDKYGISRTVSSREVVTEGISTLMCRIYEKHFDGEKLVYSGLIDKRETKFNGKILSIGLIDMMGLYTELSEKFNIVVNDASSNDSGFGVINIKNKIIEFVDILRTELNINNDYFPSYDNISENIDHEIDYYGGITVFNEPEIPVPYESGYVLEYNLDIGLYQTSLSYGSQRIASGGIDNQVKGFLKISANKNDNGYINLSFDDISLYTSLNDFDFPSENNYEYLYPVNYYGKKLKRIKNYGDDLVVNNNIQYETHTYEDEDSTRATVINAIFTYTDDNNGESSVFKFIFNVGIIGTDSRLRFSGVKEYTMTLDQQQSFEYVTSGSTSETDLLIWLKNIFSIRFGQLSSFLKSFENYFNNYICSNIVEFIGYPSNEIIYSESVEDMNKVNMVLTKESFYEKLPQNEGLMPFTYSVVMTNSYFSSIPIYSGDISFYDITKLFSLICYNRIYTDDYGVLRFDADSYESNNHIIISTNDIINNYSQDAMIGNNEEFNSLNSIYVGSGGLKIAYKRLESSVNETYKTLYENNNMKISFKLKNIDYKVYDLNNVGQYVYRKIEVNDIIRININNTGNKAFNIFVTSLKYENNGYIVSIEGITVE